ncbi:hypothetical protein AABM17_1945 [Neisseria musculi]|uniref:Lipoprotein n=1 Tax=Neisseria musculi TaxID=1815583 RepID=A0A7H1M8W2_9NEIS|nr:hypothetical protein H7A79_1944 [Neisseria musculi]
MMYKKLLLPIVSFMLVLTGCDAKDTCLDQGGRYNEATKQCEK